MTNKIYTWFTCCLVALLTTFSLTAKAEELTVNAGSATSDYVPFYGYSADYGTRSQFIIPANDLASMAGGSITGMKFFASSGADKNFSSNVWDIYFSITTESEVTSAFLDRSAATVVYSGPLALANKEMSITFASAFAYTSGNLLIEFVESTPSAYSSITWKGTAGKAVYVNGTYSDRQTFKTAATGTTVNFVPQIEFAYDPPAGACPRPGVATVASTTTTTATFEWTAGGEETAWNVAAYDGETKLDSAHVTAPTWTLATGLSASSTKTITLKVYNDCGADGINMRSNNLSVTTQCGAINMLPYVQNFDGADVPNCWTLHQSASNNPKIYSTSYYSHTGGYALYFSGKSDTCIAVLPELAADANTTMITLWEYSSTGDSYANIQVGVMNDPADVTTFVPVASLPKSSSSIQQVVYLADAPAGYKYIAFRYTGGTSSYGSAYIDDITVDVLPACMPITDLIVSDITISGATLTWGGASRADDQFAVVVKEGDDEKFNGNVTGASLVLDTLTPGKAYSLSVSITPVCDGETPEAFEKAISFNTNCLPLTTLPWEENFDSFTEGNLNVPCWSNEHVSGEGTKIFQITTSSSVSNSTKMLLLPDQSANTVTKLTLPELTIPAANEYQFCISVYRNYYSTQVGNEGVYVLAEKDTLAFIPRDYREAATGVASTSVDIAAEAEVGWYSYEFTLPKAGVYSITLVGLNQYKAATYIDNLKVRAIPSCTKPGNGVISNVGSTTAHLAWTAPENGAAAYRVKLFKGDDVIVNVASTTATELDIENLLPSTSYAGYTLQITSLCDGDLESDAYEIVVPTFDTECETISTFPWKENFESLSAGDFHKACWTNEHVDGNGSYLFTVYSSTTAIGGNSTKLLQLPDMKAGTHTLLTLPEMNIPAANEYEFLISVYRPSAASYPEEGIFVQVGEQTLAFISRDYATASSDYTVAIPAESAAGWYTYRFTLPAGLQHIAILGQSQWGSATYMDNLIVRRIPTCYAVEEVRVASTSKTSVKLEWDAPAQGGSSFEVVVKDGATEKFNGVVNDTCVVVNGFAASTTYSNISVSIVTVCSEEDKSDAFTGTVSFGTDCDAVTSFPWSENFDSYTTSGTFSETCWKNEHKAGTGEKLFSIATSTLGGNATPMMQLPDMNIGNITRLSLPLMDIPEAGKYAFYLKIYRNHSTYNSYSPIEGLRVFAKYADEEVELAFVSRQYSASNDIIPAEAAVGWYEYELVLPNAGECNIILQGESQYCSATNFDDLAVRKMPTCLAIKEANIVSLGTDTVVFGWTERQEGKQYHVEVINGANVLKSMDVDEPFIGIGQLTANTSYIDTLRITTLCPDDEEQSESEVAEFVLKFKTTCAIYTAEDLPIEEDFENVTTGAMPDCWLVINPSVQYHYIQVEEDDDTYMQAHNGDKCLGFNGGVSAQYAILPGINEDLSGLRLKFNYRNGYESYDSYYDDWEFQSASGAAYGTLTVGVMSNPGDAETFVEIQTLDKVASFTDAEISFDNAPATHHYIAIRYAGGTSAGYVSVDDLVLEAQPACRHALDAQISNIGLTTATLSWTAPTTGGYKVLLKDGETELFNDSVTTTSVQLEQLESGHIYSGLALTITTFCDAENSSEVYAATLSFTTNCDVVMGDTIRFDFEGEDYPTGKIADNLPCWKTLVSKGTPSSSSYWAVATTAHGGAKGAYLYAYTSDSVAQVLITPIVNIPANGYEMLAYLKEGTATENDSVNFYVNTVPSLEGATHIGYMKPTTDWTLFRANLGARDQLYLLIEAYAFRSIYIDDIVLQPAPQCYPIQDISFEDLTAESVRITWQHAEGQSAWTVAVEDEDGVEYSEGTMEGASYLIEGLSANTDYVLNVTITAQCDGDMESEPFSKQIAFHTPLSDDMIAIIEEDATVAIDLSDEDEQDSWALLGNNTNKFMFGEADDAPALFISDDQESWHYTVTSASAAIAYRQFRVVADTAKINVSFQWQANAETSNWDYGRAFIVPVNTECSFSGTSPVIGSTTITATSVPTNGTSLVDAMYNKTSWQSADKDVTLAAGDYLLVFTWYNDGSVGNQYPLAVKNIVLADVTNMCDKPSSLLKGATTSTSVTFSWTAGTNGASSFEVVATVNGVERAAQIVDAPNFTIDDLVPNTSYTIALSVSGICENEEHTMALTGSYTFRTPRPEDFDQTTAETIGRESTFEIDLSSADEQAKWVALGSNANAFVIGNVEAGTPGIYISNDNSTWAYTVNSTSQAMIYRTFRINDDNTEVRVTFDWQANGELLSSSAYDYGRAFIAAEAQTPAVTSSSMTLGTTTIGYSAISVEGIYSLSPSDAVYLADADSWQTLSQTVTLSAGLYRLLFTWKNDSSSGTQKPLGVKNISIENLKENESGTALDTNTLNSEVVKFIRDDQVYIQRDGAVYDIFGRKVK